MLAFAEANKCIEEIQCSSENGLKIDYEYKRCGCEIAGSMFDKKINKCKCEKKEGYYINM